MNHPHERIFELDFGEYEGFSQFGTPPLYEIAKATKEIQKDLHDIAIGFHKPVVLTEPLSEYHLEKHMSSLEGRINQFPSEIQQDILEEVSVIVSKREQEIRKKEQDEETITNVDSL